MRMEGVRRLCSFSNGIDMSYGSGEGLSLVGIINVQLFFDCQVTILMSLSLSVQQCRVEGIRAFMGVHGKLMA